MRNPQSKWYLSLDELPDRLVPWGVRYLAGWGYVLSRDVLVHALTRLEEFEKARGPCIHTWTELEVGRPRCLSLLLWDLPWCIHTFGADCCDAHPGPGLQRGFSQPGHSRPIPCAAECTTTLRETHGCTHVESWSDIAPGCWGLVLRVCRQGPQAGN